ncbi:conjugal transfer protein TraI [Dyadobacter psychrotolerans]|uniref:Conjugal transfer protein TraI n=1 Tax=Dyadobacter psychrotolerans TaxID=2541721 RepID=A0A4R5DG00_9BACT|nr:conjugal transfer protein TraI [Dyadobacter psychrotolerans]TDE10724.1 conjugal transfer protein TraI [Dyadobacter psychrotolerans]
MIRRITFSVVFFCVLLSPVQQAHAAGPWAAVIKAAVKKVVKAVDLMIQRRQNAVIKLQNAQKALENAMSELKLKEIADWVGKQRDLYEQYYDELKKVKSVIAYYFRVKQITQKQMQIVEQYQKAWQIIENDAHFSAAERLQMQRVYSGILQETVKSVDLISAVVKSFSTQMSDVERLEIIDKAARQTESIFSELTSFNDRNRILSLSRAKSQQDAQITKALYGIQ